MYSILNNKPVYLDSVNNIQTENILDSTASAQYSILAIFKRFIWVELKFRYTDLGILIEEKIHFNSPEIVNIA